MNKLYLNYLANLKSNKGFTVLELIVVLIIIGIIIGIAFPSVIGGVRRARTLRAQSFVRNWATAQNMHYTGNLSFADSFVSLDLKAPRDNYYTYEQERNNNSRVIIYARPNNPELPTVGSKVFTLKNAAGENILQTVSCTSLPGQPLSMNTINSDDQCPTPAP